MRYKACVHKAYLHKPCDGMISKDTNMNTEELIIDFRHIKGNTWCLVATAKIPFYFLDDRTVVLIDSGYPDERTRPHLDKVIEEKNTACYSMKDNCQQTYLFF